MIKKLTYFFNEVLPKLSREEADFIEEIIDWDHETKAAFKWAKSYFDDGLEPEDGTLS